MLQENKNLFNDFGTTTDLVIIYMRFLKTLLHINFFTGIEKVEKFMRGSCL